MKRRNTVRLQEQLTSTVGSRTGGHRLDIWVEAGSKLELASAVRLSAIDMAGKAEAVFCDCWNGEYSWHQQDKVSTHNVTIWKTALIRLATGNNLRIINALLQKRTYMNYFAHVLAIVCRAGGWTGGNRVLCQRTRLACLRPPQVAGSSLPNPTVRQPSAGLVRRVSVGILNALILGQPQPF